MNSFFKRIRGAIGTALTWGAGWFVGGLGMYGLFGLMGVGPAGVAAILQAALNLGILGGIVGLGSAGFIRLRYAGRSLQDISTLWFGLGGGVASSALIVATVVVGRFLTGAPVVSWTTIAASAGVAAVLGGLTAAASLTVAKAGGELTSPDGTAALDRGDEADLGRVLGPG